MNSFFQTAFSPFCYRLVCFGLVCCMVVSPRESHSQPAPESTDNTEVKEKTRDSLPASSTSSEVVFSVGDMESLIHSLQQRIVVLENQQRATPRAIQQIDEVTQEIDTLRRQVLLLDAKESASSYRQSQGNYDVAIRGYLQVRSEVAVSEGLDDIQQSSLEAPSIRIGVSGAALTPSLTYDLLLDAASGFRDRGLVHHAYLQHALGSQWDVRFGVMDVPFTRQALVEEELLDFPSRSAAIQKIAFREEVGVAVMGRSSSGRVAFTAGVYNGSGTTTPKDSDKRFTLVSRVNVGVVGDRIPYDTTDVAGAKGRHGLRVTLGGGAYLDEVVTDSDLVAGVEQQINVWGASIDAIARYKGWELGTELTFRQERWGSAITSNPDLVAAIGARANRNHITSYGHLTKYVVGNTLLVGGRVSHTRLPVLGLSGVAPAIPRADRLFGVDGLVQLYGSEGRRTVGLQYTYLNYNNKDTAEPLEDVQHRFVVEAQLQF